MSSHAPSAHPASSTPEAPKVVPKAPEQSEAKKLAEARERAVVEKTREKLKGILGEKAAELSEDDVKKFATEMKTVIAEPSASVPHSAFESDKSVRFLSFSAPHITKAPGAGLNWTRDSWSHGAFYNPVRIAGSAWRNKWSVAAGGIAGSFLFTPIIGAPIGMAAGPVVRNIVSGGYHMAKHQLEKFAHYLTQPTSFLGGNSSKGGGGGHGH